MNCPYSAEDIKTEAIVCCHCNRDLTFLQVFEKRISSLERSLKNGKSPAAPVSLETTRSWATQQQVMRILVLLQGTVVTLIIYLFGLLYQHSLLQPSNWVTLIMLAAPLPFAVFLVSF